MDRSLSCFTKYIFSGPPSLSPFTKIYIFAQIKLKPFKRNATNYISDNERT